MRPTGSRGAAETEEYGLWQNCAAESISKGAGGTGEEGLLQDKEAGR